MNEFAYWTDGDAPEPRAEPDVNEIFKALPTGNGRHVTASTDSNWQLTTDVPELPEYEEEEPQGGDIEFEPELPTVRSRLVGGATFVRDVPATIPAIWKDSDSGVVWAKGEPLMIVGPDGVGKTSIAQQLVQARTGLRTSLLGMNVEEAAGRVLYIAADRPRQAASSLRRMVTEAEEAQLEERMVVWKGPLEFDLAKSPQLLREFVDGIGGVTDVVIDSLKDLTPDLVKDETGSRVTWRSRNSSPAATNWSSSTTSARNSGRHQAAPARRRLRQPAGSPPAWVPSCCSGANPATSSSSSATSSNPKATSAPSTSSTTTPAERQTSTSAPTSSRRSPQQRMGSPSPTQHSSSSRPPAPRGTKPRRLADA